MNASGHVLRVGLVQSKLHWHDAQANRDHLTTQIMALANSTDVIVLPEMFTTGFTMETARLAEPPEGPTCEWLRKLSAATNAAITGSLIVNAGTADYRNRMLFVQPDGAVHFYDKRHLFRMGGEHKAFAAGSSNVVVSWRGFRIGLLVCYDLRFPVWSRRRAEFDYDVLIYVANWPAVRAYPWTQLLRARAIENQSFVIGLNRIGRDGHGIAHQGDSTALDFLGKPLVELDSAAGTATAVLDGGTLRVFREKFPAQLDADDFELKP